MNGLEGTPFYGKFQGFGGKSYDSVAGLLKYKTVGIEDGETWNKAVLKWNRVEISSDSEAWRVVEFRKRSIDLYRLALGDEYVVPTWLVLGGKKDGKNVKRKIFQVQPFIDGCSGSDASEEVRERDEVRKNWMVLSKRLYNLYQVAANINKGCQEEAAFQIGLTLGSSREASSYEILSFNLPRTKNIIIEGNSGLKLFDFGEYAVWDDSMLYAYECILRETRLN